MDAVNKCRGDVYIVSTQGDQINLKSELSMYIGIGEILKDKSEMLELFCTNKEDTSKMIEFLVDLNT